MKLWLFSLLCLVHMVCFAQTKTITGIVQDSLGKPIPYATIIEQKGRVGVIADESGKFMITIPDSISTSSIAVSCLGFETQLVQIASLKTGSSNSITLQYKQIVLSPLVVSSKRAKFCSETRGVKNKKSHGSFHLKSGDEIALFIPTTIADSGIVKAVRYYIMKDGVVESPFRIKLYKIDPVTQCPGEVLLDHDTIVHATRGNQWLEVDLSGFNIPVPDNGFFVSMQWLPNSQAYTKVLGNNSISANGQVIGLIKNKSMTHWIYTFAFGWKSSTNFAMEYQPMIAAVLSKECE